MSLLSRPSRKKAPYSRSPGNILSKLLIRANKVQIKEAVERNFGVEVLDVNVSKLRGKRKRYGPRQVKQPDTKKAVVTLKAGDRINLIEGL